MICKNCGMQLSEETKCCPNCGMVIEDNEVGNSYGFDPRTNNNPYSTNYEANYNPYNSTQYNVGNMRNASNNMNFSNYDYQTSTGNYNYQTERNYGVGLSVASMVCGILAYLLTCCVPVFPAILALFAIAFSVAPIRDRRPVYGMAIAGLVCGIIALIPQIIILFTGAVLVDSTDWYI